MSEQGTPVKAHTLVGKASARTSEAARELLRAAHEDFNSPPFGNIMAAWSQSGLLVIVAQGDKAHQLDAVLRFEDLAIPDGQRPKALPNV